MHNSVLKLVCCLAAAVFARTQDFGGSLVPVAPGPATTWDWTSNNNFPLYGSPWDPSSSNGGILADEYDRPSDGWILYDRRLFAGDHNLTASTLANSAGTLYFALYNRYTGILRIFHLSSSNINANGKYATLQVTDANYSATGTQNQSLQGNLFNTAASSGYSGTYATPGQSRVITRYAPGSGSTTNPWWIFDFQMDYDPIGVGQPRYFDIDVRAVTTSTLTFSGSLSGTISTQTAGLGFPLDLAFDAAKSFAPSLVTNSINWISQYLPGGTGLGGILLRNSKDISKSIASGLVSDGVSALTSLNGASQTTQVASFFSADFQASGSLVTDVPVGKEILGVLDPNYPSSDAYAPTIVKNRGNLGGLSSLGVINYSRAPTVWIYTGGRNITTERDIYGYSLTTTNKYYQFTDLYTDLAVALGSHQFKIEDPWCSGILNINPGSQLRVIEVSTAINETNWNYVGKYLLTDYYPTYIFWGLQKKSSDFSEGAWQTSWPTSATGLQIGGSQKSGYTYSTLAPILPGITSVPLSNLSDNTITRFPYGDQNGRPAEYDLVSSGGQTPSGESYSNLARLSVTVLVSFVSPVGHMQMYSILPVTNVQYVSSLSAFNAINQGGYACADRKRANVNTPALRVYLQEN